MFRAYDDSDPNQADIDIFECGHINGGHHPKACPHDPAFPALSDYELNCKEVGADHWLCFAKPKTAAARRHHLGSKVGPTEREARNRLIESYIRGAPSEKQIQPEC